MIPNVFISSTIQDLHYLRDGLRDAVEELMYHPVMSDHGEIGYINPNSAAESCYRSIKDCQLVVLLIGKRYGAPGGDGLSVTHRELRAAINEGIPLISFVEPQILSFKEVHDAEPASSVWSNFKGMDYPKKTFALLEEVTSTQAYNGLIPIHSVGDAKRKLKLQIANFVGDRLSETVQPLRREIQEVLAQMSALRTEVTKDLGFSNSSKKILMAMRFLLEDRHADYRKFVEQIYGDLELAIQEELKLKNFEELVVSAELKLKIIPDENAQAEVMGGIVSGSGIKPKLATFGLNGGYAIMTDDTLKISQRKLEQLKEMHAVLLARLRAV